MRFLLSFILFSHLTGFSQSNYHYQNLALEGAGIRGLAYSGALKVLEERGIIKNIERVAGTSSGAAIGMMICVGYTSHEIDSVFQSLEIEHFNDGKNIFGIIRRVKKEYGIFRGDKYEKWLSCLIKYKMGSANITFSELHELRKNNPALKDLYCTGTNITQQRLQIFSWQQTPNMLLKCAVHISGCIPVYFKPVAIDSLWNKVPVKKNKGKFDIYVDGGMINNFPINMFDTCLNGGNPFDCDNVKYNMQTLGLKLERPEQIERFNNGITAIAPYKVSSLNDYEVALINLLQEILARKTINLVNVTGRTIFISHGDVFGKIRKVSLAEKKQLFDYGVTAAEHFLMEHK